MVWYLPDLTKSRQLWPAPPPAPALLEWARRFSHGAGTGASLLRVSQELSDLLIDR